MKKILIPAFFVGMILLSYLVAKAAATFKMDDKNEILYTTYKDELSDSEVTDINYNRGSYPHLKTGDRVTNYKCYDVKETRTKKIFSWDLKVDTINTYYVTEDGNQR